MIPIVILSIEDDNDRSFMTEFYLRYERLMYSEIRKIVKDQCDPEDVLQTSLIKLIEKVKLLRSLDERPRVNYLITTVKHTAITEMQRLTKRTIHSLDDVEWYEREGLHTDESVDDLVERRESVSRMEEVWLLLDDKSRYLLSAKYFLGLEQDEIADELNIKPDSVRMEMSRARKKVRELLAENFSMTDIWT